MNITFLDWVVLGAYFVVIAAIGLAFLWVVPARRLVVIAASSPATARRGSKLLGERRFDRG